MLYAGSDYPPMACPGPPHSVISRILKVTHPGYHHAESSLASFRNLHRTLDQDNGIPSRPSRRSFASRALCLANQPQVIRSEYSCAAVKCASMLAVKLCT